LQQHRNSPKGTFFSVYYCKTCYFCCILILQFCNVEILLHFHFALSKCSTGIYQAFDGQTFSRLFNFAILTNSRNLRNFMQDKITWFTVPVIMTRAGKNGLKKLGLKKHFKISNVQILCSYLLCILIHFIFNCII